MSIKRKIFVHAALSLVFGLITAWQIIACLAAKDEFGTNLHLVGAGLGIIFTIVFLLFAVLNVLMRHDATPRRQSGLPVQKTGRLGMSAPGS